MINPPDRSAQAKSASRSPNVETLRRLPISPPREKLSGTQPPRELAPQGGVAPSGEGASTTALSEEKTVSGKRRALRGVLLVAGAVGVAATALGALVWRHYAIEAGKFDLARLQSLNEGPRAVDRHGKFVGSLFSVDREFVKVNEVPAHVIDALLATEDARYFSHGGVDPKGIFRAAWVNARQMAVRQGGSTITQQLVRQAFVLRGRNLKRKMLETALALRLEASYTKHQILEFYLNQIYLGSGYYGVGAAARGYFGKKVKDLTLEEAALIAGIIKAPVALSPHRSMTAAERARNLTLDRMLALGMIDDQTAGEAKIQPVKVTPPESRFDRPSYVIAAVEKELGAGKQGEVRDAVPVTVDVELQTRMNALVNQHVERVETQFDLETGTGQVLQAAAIVLDNETGDILAMTGGRDYRTSPFDRALQGMRPAGTAFLPLAYAAILAVAPDMASAWVLDGPLDNRRVMIGGREGTLGEWGAENPRNAYEGYIPALYALLRAKTSASVRLGYDAGLSGLHAQLQRCGLSSRMREEASFLLGTGDIRLVELARACGALARSGKLPPPPHLLAADTAEVRAPSGVAKFSIQAFAEPAANLVRGVLVAVLQQPDLQPVLRDAGLANCGLGGYGGTAYGFTDAWFVGFDQRITCAVWMGYDTSRSIAREAWSRVTAFPLWAEIMSAALGGAPRGWTLRGGEPVMCLYSGCGATPECVKRNDGSLIPIPAGADCPTGPCPVHDAAKGSLPSGTDEVLRPVRWSRIATAAGGNVRPVLPKEAVVVGADLYQALADSKIR